MADKWGGYQLPLLSGMILQVERPQLVGKIDHTSQDPCDERYIHLLIDPIKINYSCRSLGEYEWVYMKYI